MDTTIYLRFFFDNGFITDIEYDTNLVDEVMIFSIGTGNKHKIIGIHKIFNYNKKLYRGGINSSKE